MGKNVKKAEKAVKGFYACDFCGRAEAAIINEKKMKGICYNCLLNIVDIIPEGIINTMLKIKKIHKKK